MKIYFDFNDWWIGYYKGDHHHYICILPTLVIKWNRKIDLYRQSLGFKENFIKYTEDDIKLAKALSEAYDKEHGIK